MDWVKTTARWDEKHLGFEIWCDLYKRFYGTDSHVDVTEISQWKLIKPKIAAH